MPVTEAQFDIVKNEHEALRQIFRWQSDDKTWQKREHWTRPQLVNGELVGDCEDNAIELFYRLLSNGIEAADIKLCGCFVPQRNAPRPHHDVHINHITLAIKTDTGVFISDCNSQFVEPLGSLLYMNWCWPKGAINGKWVKIK